MKRRAQRGTLLALVMVGLVAVMWGGLSAPMAAGETTSALGSTISADRNYYVVQFSGPVRAAWKLQAIARGAEFMYYVPRFAFAARMTAAQSAAVAALPNVRSVYPLPTTWKYRSRLTKSADQPVTVNVTLFPGERTERVVQFITDRNLMVLGGGYARDPIVRTRMVARLVPQLAALPEVAWIQEYHRPVLSNDLGQRFLNVSNVAGLPEGIDVWQDYGLFGQGQIVGIADTGLDTGNINNLHADFLDGAGSPRLLQAFARGRVNDWSDSTTLPLAVGGHGTHVAGSVLGNGTMSGADAATQSFSGSFAGIAPQAQLVFQSVMDSAGSLGGLPAHLGTLFQQSYQAGARIHSNSWGSSTYGDYTAYCQQLDAFMWSHPEMTILFSAGNSGIDWDEDGVIDETSVGSPATAKNCISIGASENYRPPSSGWGGYADYTYSDLWYFYYPAPPISTDYPSDDPGGMAAFSSRGPCLDGRIKPDLVAPGTNVISCYSRGKLGDHSGVESLWGVYDDDYLYSGGTSMATPLVAGAAALVREYYQTIGGDSAPSGALVKATLINGATDLAPGQYGTGATQELSARPDRSQGWGRANVGASLFPGRVHTGAGLFFHDYGMISDTGATDVHPLTMTGSGAPLEVTLVWTDAPAALVASKQLVNDLDLVVVAPGGKLYRGNYGAVPVNDRINNVEHVTIAAPVAGVYNIRVVGYNVPTGPQPYALVATGMVSTAPGYRLAGTVRDAGGRAVSGIAVTVEGIDVSPGRRVSAATRSDGSYVVAGLTAGRYRVTPAHYNYTFTPAELRVEVAAADVTGVDFEAQALSVASGYTIAGNVTDREGKPVAGVAITVSGTMEGLGESDASGRYVITGLVPGDYTITPEQPADGYIGPDERYVSLPSSESIMQDFQLVGLLSGLIDVYTLTPTRQPLVATTMTVQRSADGVNWTTVQTKQTNTAGFVRLGGTDAQGNRVFIDRYRYRISAHKAGYAFQTTPFYDYVEGPLPSDEWAYASPVPATTATFFFWGGSPQPLFSASGSVLTTFQRPVVGASVRLEGVATGRVFTTHTLTNGTFRVSGMPADKYQIKVEKAGYTITPFDPLTGSLYVTPPDPLEIKVGPPAHTNYADAVLYSPEEVWSLGFSAWATGALVDGGQRFWAVPE